MANQKSGIDQWIAPLALVLLHGLLFWFALGAVLEGRADFANFYSAAVMVRNGQPSHIYDAEAQRQLQGRLFPQGDSRGGALLFLHASSV